MENIINELSQLISALSSRNMGDISRKGWNGKLTTEEIVAALNDYPGTISSSEIDLSRVNFIEYDDYPDAGILEYELEIDGSVSDLTLSCEYNAQRTPHITIENIHVM